MHKDFPIPNHQFSRHASVAALAAGEQKKYWEYHDKIMQNMSSLSLQKFLDFAKEIGLDMDAFQKSLMDQKHEEHINKDVQDGINAGITGTPTIYLNGRIVTNRSMDGIKALIDEEVQKKKKK